jgi:hypothetical protein
MLQEAFETAEETAESAQHQLDASILSQIELHSSLAAVEAALARASPAPESARFRLLEANLQAILIHQGELNHMMRTLFMRKACILHALAGRTVLGQAEVKASSLTERWVSQQGLTER